jgi:hypothetical protein
MSPEQARGDTLDGRSDLYSVGVVLYQLATGELPFQSETPVGYLAKHLAETPPRARERRAEVSGALDAVIARAMEKDPAARFQTADEMREALLAVSRPHAAAQRGARAPGARRARRLFWVFAAAMGVAVAGGGAVTVLARRSVAERKGHPDTISPAEAGASAFPTPTASPSPQPSPPLRGGEGGQATPGKLPAADGGEGDRGTPRKLPAADGGERGQETPRKLPAAATKRDRAAAASLYRRAEARRAEQDVDGAIALYLAAEVADPGLAEVQKKLGLCYQLKGDTRRAASRYRRYLATRPADAERVRAILSTLE